MNTNPAMRPAEPARERDWEWMLILACLPLLATNALFNIPMGLMALLGAWRLAQDLRAGRPDPILPVVAGLAACIWVPMLLSLPDAVRLERSLETTASYLRFPLAAYFMASALRSSRARRRLLLGAALIVGFWSIDAIVQYFAGRNLFGQPHDTAQLQGIFHPKLRLGLVTAPLLPLIIAAGFRRRWMVLLLAPAIAAVILSGNRNAWVMLGVIGLCYAVRALWGQVAPGRRGALPLAALLAVLLVAGPWQRAELRDRLDVTLELFSGEEERIDDALSYRLSLWRAAVDMAREHWINGVGPRGFRYDYREHAQENDWFLAHGFDGSTHPHQQVLEVMVETGIVGLAGYALFWLLLLRLIWRSDAFARAEASPWLLGAIVALLPTGAHMAFYGTYWSTFCWWLLGIGLAVLTRDVPDQSPAATRAQPTTRPAA